MMKRLMTLALSSVIAVSAFAQTFSETESNDTRGSADMALYGLSAPWARVGVLSLTANDSDFFKISLNAGDYLTAITFPTATTYDSPDTVMAIFDASGNTAIDYNDDAGGGYGSAIRWQADQTGDYFIAITGYHGGGKDSITYYEGASHSEAGSYILTVSVVPVPEPASMIALGTGLVSLMALRRRNRN